MITLDIKAFIGTVVVLAFVIALGMDRFRQWRRESERRAIWREEQKKQPRAIR
jgi:hypothetical protein